MQTPIMHKPQGMDPSETELFLHSQSVHSLIELIVAFTLTRFRQALHL
jgi:hypothetical protein